MEETGNKSWKDITIPCDILFHENDIVGITNNKVLQDRCIAATEDMDFLKLVGHGWIMTDLYTLDEILPEPKKETASSPEKPSKE